MEDVALAPHDAAALTSVPPLPPERDLTLVPDADPALGRMDVRRSPEQAEQLVLDLIAAHADSLLRTARRYSLCADDAQDAYQRGLEILMRHAARLDADRAGGWLHTVVKHEALAINRARTRIVGGDDVDFDAIEMRTAASPEERVLGLEQVARSAEALQRLKPQEVQALWLKAQGLSYQEIAQRQSWTYTKVNRCITEGRRAVLARYARIEGGDECERWLPLLSAIVDGEATHEQLLEIRPHLRNCTACRATVREMHATAAPLAALLPVALAPAAAADDKSSLFARAWDTIFGGLHDRAAAVAFKVQAATEATSTGKLAAIAASAAAIGGGAVVAKTSVPAKHRPATAHARPVAQRATPAPPTPTAPGRKVVSAAAGVAKPHAAP